MTNTNNTGTLSYQWRRNGNDIAGATNSTYVTVKDDIGYRLSVFVISSVQVGYLISNDSERIAKADGPNAPTGITSMACTDDNNNNGMITGVTADMEYKYNDETSYHAVLSPVLIGLYSGIYNIRYKETDTHLASQVANIVVNAYHAQTLYGVTVNNGSADPIAAEGGTTITITANDPQEGYVFDKWVSDNDVIFADDESATTTFTMLACNVTVTATYKKTITPTPTPTPTHNTTSGLSGGAVAGIVIGAALLASVAGFSIYWFVVKKKSFADLKAIFKKK